jgi:hypothetical protein
MIAVEFNHKRNGSGMIVVNVPARGFDVGQWVKTQIDNKTGRVFWRDARTLLIDAWPHDVATVIAENGIVQFTVMRHPAVQSA